MNALVIGLFILAAIFGLVVLTRVLKNKPTPKPAVFIHGILAASALAILLFSTYLNPSPILIASSVFFIVAAIGGFTLFSFDMRGKAVPKLLALLHPLIAVIGLVALIIYVLQ